MPFKRKTPYDSGVPDLWAIILSSVLPNLMRMHRDKFTDMLLTDPETKTMLFEKLIQNRVYTHRVLGQQDKIQVVRDESCTRRYSSRPSVRCYELQHLPECVNHVLRFVFLHQDKFHTFCRWFEPVQEDYTLKQSEDGALEVYLSPLSLSWAYEGALTEALRERASPPPDAAARAADCADEESARWQEVDGEVSQFRAHQMLLKNFWEGYGVGGFPDEIYRDVYEAVEYFDHGCMERYEEPQVMFGRSTRMRLYWDPGRDPDDATLQAEYPGRPAGDWRALHGE